MSLKLNKIERLFVKQGKTMVDVYFRTHIGNDARFINISSVNSAKGVREAAGGGYYYEANVVTRDQAYVKDVHYVESIEIEFSLKKGRVEGRLVINGIEKATRGGRVNMNTFEIIEEPLVEEERLPVRRNTKKLHSIRRFGRRILAGVRK